MSPQHHPPASRTTGETGAMPEASAGGAANASLRDTLDGLFERAEALERRWKRAHRARCALLQRYEVARGAEFDAMRPRVDRAFARCNRLTTAAREVSLLLCAAVGVAR